MAELVQMPFEGITCVGPRNIVLDEGSAAGECIRRRRGVRETRRCGLLPNYFEHLSLYFYES